MLESRQTYDSYFADTQEKSYRVIMIDKFGADRGYKGFSSKKQAAKWLSENQERLEGHFGEMKIGIEYK